MIEQDANKQTIPVAHFPGGGAQGIVSAEKACIFVEETLLNIPDLFPVVMADSVGSITAAALYLRDPDDPSHPSLTAHEYALLLRRNVTTFLNIPTHHYPKHALHAALRITGAVPPVNYALGRCRAAYNACARTLGLRERTFSLDWLLHVDRQESETILERYFGGRPKLRDLMGTVVIGSRIIHPENRPFDFVKIDPAHVRPEGKPKRLLEQPNSDLIKVVLASSAVPSIFPSITMEETGTVHVDYVQFRNQSRMLRLLDKALPEHMKLGYVLFGIFDHSRKITPEFYSRANAVDVWSLLGADRHHNNEDKKREQLLDAADVTDDEAYDLGTPFRTMYRRGLKTYPRMNPLCCTPEQVDALVNITREDFAARRDHYMRVIEYVYNAWLVRQKKTLDSTHAFRQRPSPPATLPAA